MSEAEKAFEQWWQAEIQGRYPVDWSYKAIAKLAWDEEHKATLDEVRKEFIGNGWTGCESAKAMRILDKLESEGTNE